MSVVINQLRINAVTRADRDDVISRVREAMTAGGAWVLDVKQFSNVSVCFTFEIPSRNTTRLRAALVSGELRLISESDDSFSSVRDQTASDGADVAGTLQIIFIHNEPDLRIKVPSIPG